MLLTGTGLFYLKSADQIAVTSLNSCFCVVFTRAHEGHSPTARRPDIDPAWECSSCVWHLAGAAGGGSPAPHTPASLPFSEAPLRCSPNYFYSDHCFTQPCPAFSLLNRKQRGWREGLGGRDACLALGCCPPAHTHIWRPPRGQERFGSRPGAPEGLTRRRVPPAPSAVMLPQEAVPREYLASSARGLWARDPSGFHLE